MYKKVLILVTILSAISAYSDCSSYKPVCGEDNRTYHNACQCKKAYVKVKYVGACGGSNYAGYKVRKYPQGGKRWNWNSWDW